MWAKWEVGTTPWFKHQIQTSDPEFYFETHMESILDNLLLHEQHSGYLTTLLLYTHIVTRTGGVPTGRFDGTSATSSLSKRFLLTGFPEWKVFPARFPWASMPNPDHYCLNQDLPYSKFSIVVLATTQPKGFYYFYLQELSHKHGVCTWESGELVCL